MNCPRCQSILKIGERSGVEIDYCESCRGIWLDAGEIDKIIERTSRQFDNRANQGQGQAQAGEERESWWERILDVFD